MTAYATNYKYNPYNTKSKVFVSSKFGDNFFLIGVFLIPFDNLVIAPSAGWASIAPFLFLLYILLNLSKSKNYFKRTFFITFLIILYSYLIFMMNASMFFNVELIDTLGTLALGFSFYLSLKIYFGEKAISKTKKFFKTLIWAYSLSYVYGLVSLIPISQIQTIMSVIEKRHYARLQFSFTEPSFISMHIYGILLPLSIIGHNKKGITISILFILTSLVFGESARFIIDTAIVLLIMITNYFIRRKKYILIFLFWILCFVAMYLIMCFDESGRVTSILKYGIYYDNSLAARWFRVNATLNGIDFIHFIFGYGVSNVSIPLNNGYSIAFSQVSNSWLDEIISLKGSTSSTIFCMPVRMIAEFGFPIFVYFVAKSFSKKHLAYFLIICYLYIQFDSYAFFAFWIYLFIKNDSFNIFKNHSTL